MGIQRQRAFCKIGLERGARAVDPDELVLETSSAVLLDVDPLRAAPLQRDGDGFWSDSEVVGVDDGRVVARGTVLYRIVT